MAITPSGAGRKIVRLTLWVALGTAAVATPALAAGQSQAQRPLTFTKDIAPILQRSCQNCHQNFKLKERSSLYHSQTYNLFLSAIRRWIR